MDVAAKHDRIHLYRNDDEPVQRDAAEHTEQSADQCQGHALAVDVGKHLAVIEAQHLDGGNFLDALGNVDVGKVVQHHKGQAGGTHNDQHHHSVDGVEHIQYLGHTVPGESQAGHIIHLQQCGGNRIVGRIAVISHSADDRIVADGLAKALRIGGCAHIHVVAYIVLADTCDCEGTRFAVAVLQCDGIPCLDIQQLGQFFRQDYALLFQGGGRTADTLVKVKEVRELFHILGDHQVNIRFAIGNGLAGGFHGYRQRLIEGITLEEVLIHIALFQGFLLGDDSHEVIVGNLTKLLGDDGIEGI